MMNHIEAPDLVDYPEFYNIKDNFTLFNNVYCYVIEKYKFSGTNLYIGFFNDIEIIRMSDFKSNELDLNNIDDFNNEILKYSRKLSEVMRHARINQLSFYFSNDIEPTLVDVMSGANKFLGPGMLRDLFSNVVRTQKIIEIKNIDDHNTIDENLLYKPSRFRYAYDNEVIKPVYGIS